MIEDEDDAFSISDSEACESVLSIGAESMWYTYDIDDSGEAPLTNCGYDSSETVSDASRWIRQP